MKKIAITKGNGKWFDAEKAERFIQATWWNGNNQVSKATGDVFNHEALYLTASKNWVLNRWSDYQSIPETFDIISEDEAVIWFLKQSMDLPEQLKGKDIEYEI